MQNKRQIGNRYENIIAKYLEGHGYKIIEQQYRCKIGEIDIIAEKDNTIIFVEVKYRKNIFVGYPREAVNLKKQTRIRMVAENYINEKNIYDSDFRFDVAEVIGGEKSFTINYLENCF